MSDRITPVRRFMRLPRGILAGIALAMAAAGCDVRDERAVTGRQTRWWGGSIAGPAATNLMSGPATPPAATPAIEYLEGFDAGGRRAGDSALPMLVVFRADWCPWSGELARAVVADDRVVELSRRFVCVAVDADRDAEACRRFDVRTFPTVLLLDADGGERFRATGSSAATGLAGAMGDVLAAAHRPSRMAAVDTEGSR